MADDDDDVLDRTRRLGEAERAVANLHDRIRQDWRAPTNKRVQMACDDGRLVAEFVDRYLEQEVAEVIRAALRQDKDFVDAFEIIHLIVNQFVGCLDAIGRTGPEDTLVKRLTSLADDLLQGLDEAVNAFGAVVKELTRKDPRLAVERSEALRLASDIQSQSHARRLIREVEQMRDETLRVHDDTKRVHDKTKQVAGDVAANRLGGEYDSHANAETHIADRLRWVVAGLVVIITACAVGSAVWMDHVSLRTELIRLSATVPLAVLAGYLARESTKHRKAARWARDLAIAMHTLPGYTEPLDVIGLELRRALGMRAFGTAPEQSMRPDETEIYDNPTKLLDRLEEIVHRGREAIEGRSKTQ